MIKSNTSSRPVVRPLGPGGTQQSQITESCIQLHHFQPVYTLFNL